MINRMRFNRFYRWFEFPTRIRVEPPLYRSSTLPYENYSWMEYLADGGFDVFAIVPTATFLLPNPPSIPP